MTFDELSERSMRVRRQYAALEQRRYGRPWSVQELALGFVGDVGDLAKLVLAQAGVRAIPDHREQLGHELADCLWSVLVYQVAEQGRGLGLQPAYSTTETIEDPDSWTPAALFFPEQDPPGVERWIDFWVICDESRAHLFFTSLDGRLWRMATSLDAFPHHFTDAQCVLTEDYPDWRLYEASHTYRVKGEETYLTIVEGQDRRHDNRRFFLAYVADRLDGVWRPLAATAETPFASCENVMGERWAEHISHGELLRDSADETLTVDATRLQFLIQGTTAASAAGKKYGEIPWRLGLLTSVAGG